MKTTRTPSNCEVLINDGKDTAHTKISTPQIEVASNTVIQSEACICLTKHISRGKTENNGL